MTTETSAHIEQPSHTDRYLPSDTAYIKPDPDGLTAGIVIVEATDQDDDGGDSVSIGRQSSIMLYELLRVGNGDLPERDEGATDFSLCSVRNNSHSAPWVEMANDEMVAHSPDGEEVRLNGEDRNDLKRILKLYQLTLDSGDTPTEGVSFPGSLGGTDGLTLPVIKPDHNHLLEHFYEHEGVFDPEGREYLREI